MHVVEKRTVQVRSGQGGLNRTQGKRSGAGQERMLGERVGQRVQDPEDHNQIKDLSHSLLLARKYRVTKRLKPGQTGSEP